MEREGRWAAIVWLCAAAVAASAAIAFACAGDAAPAASASPVRATCDQLETMDERGRVLFRFELANVSHAAVNRVVVRFYSAGLMGEEMGEPSTVTLDGAIPAGRTVKRVDSVPAPPEYHEGKFSSLTCAIDRVRFAAGGVWQAPSPESVENAASAVVKAFYAWYLEAGTGAGETNFAPAKRFFEPTLFAAIRTPCVAGLDWDPFLAGNAGWQSYEIGPPLISGDLVLVPVRIRLPHSDTYDSLAAIVKQNASGAYVIDDVAYGGTPARTLRKLAVCAAPKP